MFLRTKYSKKDSVEKKKVSEEDNFVHNKFLPWFSLNRHISLSHGACAKLLVITKPPRPVSPDTAAKPRLGPRTFPTVGHQIQHPGISQPWLDLCLLSLCSPYYSLLNILPPVPPATLPSCFPLYGHIRAHALPWLHLPCTSAAELPCSPATLIPLSSSPTLKHHLELLEVIKSKLIPESPEPGATNVSREGLDHDSEREMHP